MEKHQKASPVINCNNKAFQVRVENFFISVDTGTGK